MNASKKIQALRSVMLEKDIQACIIPTTDPHISEYTPAYWETRKWLSGFTGSAGTLVVTTDNAGLWTDSRYFIQAEQQLEGSGITLFKSGLQETPSYQEWLNSGLSQGARIGIEGKVFAATDAKALINYFADKDIRIDTDFAPADILWTDRPPLPSDPAFVLPEHFSGASAKNKITQVLETIHKEGADCTVLAALDSIAWLFNIRGNDVDYNPVVVSYAIISDKETVWFVNPTKVTEEVKDYLSSEGIILADYDRLFYYLKRIPSGSKILLTNNKINYQLYTAIPDTCCIIEKSIHPVDSLKSIKNETEIAGFRNALLRDGVAMVRFQIELERLLKEGVKVSELDVAEMLRKFRSWGDYYFGESFTTIAGYNEHAALAHYSATEESSAELRQEGILLVDSGAQYFDGTTDITRTYALGEVNDTIKRDYTNVLKGHIALASAKFPKGTKGVQLDVLARQALWAEGCNYLHGTGHGIGHFLNVHEGPQSIRMEHNPVTLDPGMITSNEPSVYRQGSHGIRIENLILTVKEKTTESGDFYAFETLTLCPIDKKPISKDLLTELELQWLNNYHQFVYDQLSPMLAEEENKTLKMLCAPL